MSIYIENYFGRRCGVMGEKVFSVAEAEKIRHLLHRKVRAARSEQKVIQGLPIRRLGFYISDFTSSPEGFAASDFDDLVERREITIADGPRQKPSRTLLTYFPHVNGTIS